MTDALPTITSLTHRLAEHVAETPFGAIPAEAREAAKLFLLDTLACAWAGSDAPGCREAHALLAEEGGRSDATAWAFGTRMPAQHAAFLNGTTSAALDYDALGRGVPVHVNVAVMPAALAVAERQGATGAEALAAIVLGSDVTYRLALAGIFPHRGWSYTSVLGAFGAAAATARLLKLDAAATRHALGLAYLQAAGTQQANIEPSLAKRMLSGWGARAGTFAALLAARGITAPAAVIEGAFGLHRMYQPGDPAVILDRLGAWFGGTDLSIKKYPSCGCNHTAIEAMLRLRALHGLTAAHVGRIRARISPYMDRIVGMTYDPSRDPQVAAQFSIRYSLACALVRGRLGLAEIEAEAAHDPAINEVVPRVLLDIEPSWTSDRGPVELTVETTDGRVLTAREENLPGSREAPIPPEDLQGKFAECLGRGVRPLRPAARREMMARLDALERWPDMRGLLDLPAG
jgi:2-methylcitrate dehydratase PrpD